MFLRTIFNDVFLFLKNNNLLTSKQSGFRPDDSCVNQLLSIVHSIYSNFDHNPTLEIRGIVLDISKVLDKGLLYKLETFSISGNLLRLFQSFLSYRQLQTITLNGQHSKWTLVLTGFPQWSRLGSLLFLIYINNLPENLESSTKLFADDTSLFSTVYDLSESANSLNDDLKKISEWAFKWKMTFNPDTSIQAQEVNCTIGILFMTNLIMILFAA